jgi:hypothetical protein
MERALRWWAALFWLLPLLALAAESTPRLVLQITVDQLRGDLPFRDLSANPWPRLPHGGADRSVDVDLQGAY